MRVAARLMLVLTVVGAAAAASVGCGQDETSAEQQCVESTKIEKLKELIVVDEDVLHDDRAMNAKDGAWSFRHSIENLAPSPDQASAVVMTWLKTWADVTEMNGVPTDRPNESRAVQVQERIICPWLKYTPANGCNIDCSACTSQTLDLALSPFRLIAISNRIDLRQEVADEPSGEGRFVYALTDGPADDPASKPVAFTMIFEYRLPETRSTKEWAETWHELGKFDSYGEPYRAALESVTNAFAKRDARPGATNGSALSQVRTNESHLNWIWQLREFGIAQDGFLRLRPARNTPAETFNGTPKLAEWISQNAAAIESKRFELPISMRAPSVDQLVYTWTIPAVDDKLRHAFASQTCNGCHSFDNPSVDKVFHVSPYRQGVEKLSPFVYQPNGGPDELTARTASMTTALCRGQ
jgi:hypothetical protein